MHLSRRLTARAAILVDLPVGPSCPDFLARQALVVAVVELAEQGHDLGVVEACQLRRAQGPLHVTRERGGELATAQRLTQATRIILALRQEGEVRATAVLAGVGPGC